MRPLTRHGCLLSILASLVLPLPPSQASTWNVDAGGYWGDSLNWSGGVPDSAGAQADLTFDITADRTVSIELNKTAGVVNIGDTGNQYTVTNDGYWKALLMDNNGAGAQFNVLAGSSVLFDSATGTVNLIAQETLTITLNAGSTLTFGHNGVLDGEANDLIITGAGNLTTPTLSGTGTITKNGTGTVTLTGNNDYNAGALVINGGNWVVQGTNKTTSATVGDGAVLDLTNTSGSMKSLTSLTIDAGGQVLLGAHGNHSVGGNQFASQQIGNANSAGLGATGAIFTALTLDGTLTLSNAGQSNLDVSDLSGAATGVLAMNANSFGTWVDTGRTATYAGVITGTGASGFYKHGEGTQVLSGANTGFGGLVSIEEGVLRITNGSALGDTWGNTTVMSGTTLQLAGDITTGENIIIRGTGKNDIGAINNLSGDNTLGGAITLNGDATISSSAGTLTADASGGFAGNNCSLTLDAASGSEIVVNRALGDLSALTKNGAGTVTLNAANTYAGSTAINAGTLVLNGSATSSFTVGAAGTLASAGTITGNLVNHGAVRLGDTPGTLTVNGDFSNNSTGTLYLGIISSASHGQLQVGGAASLSGALSLSLADGYLPSNTGDSITLISAADGVAGTFDTTSLSTSAFRTTLVYTEDSVILEVSFYAYADSALTPNQRAVATALDTVRASSPTGDAATVINTLNTLDAAGLRTAFDQFASAPLEFNAAMHSDIIAINTATRTNLDTRFDRLRTGRLGATVGILSLRDRIDGRLSFENMPLLASADDSFVPAGRPPEPARWGSFISGTALQGDTETRGGQAGYSSDVETATVGLDYQLNSDLTIGAYLTYANSDQDLTQGLGGMNARNIGAGLYAQWQAANGCYLNATAGAGWTDFKNRRVISLFNRVAIGKPEGHDYFLSLSGGRDYTHGAWSFGPVASLTHSGSTVNGYTETGAGFLNLNVEESTRYSTRSSLGAKVARQFQVGSSYLVPQIMVAWQHEFQETSQTLSGSFSQTPAPASFSVSSQNTAPDTMVTGIGAECLLSAGTSLYAQYYAELFNPDYCVQGVTAGLQFSF